MERPATRTWTILERWAALLPLVMSLLGLAVVLGRVALVGTIRQPDEGLEVRIWWLLLGGQLPFIGLFAVAALPARPRLGAFVLLAQGVAILANLALVRYLEG
jgi:hypothetical protein